MRKLILTLSAFVLSVAAIICSCGESEEKKTSKSDSLSMAMDSARANDTLLIKLKKENNKTK